MMILSCEDSFFSLLFDRNTHIGIEHNITEKAHEYFAVISLTLLPTVKRQSTLMLKMGNPYEIGFSS
jgi:hypothetical protein